MHGQAMRTVRVSGGSDETPQLKREDSKQVHLWLLFSSVVFCFLTFSSLFIARKSADCFNIAIIVVARVSCMRWA